jgi:hypothetical protein
VDYDAPRWYVYLAVPLGYLFMLAIVVFLLTRPGAFDMFRGTDTQKAEQ